MCGNLNGWRYVMAEDSSIFSFFPDPNQSANFMALAGIVCFGFALEGLRFKRSLNMVGFVASGMCLFSLILSLSGTGLSLLSWTHTDCHRTVSSSQVCLLFELWCASVVVDFHCCVCVR